MKAPPFTYHRPDTLDAALSLLAEHGDDAKILAGGQSLIPLMGLRMGRPDHIIDIGRIPGLSDITVHDDRSVTLGALVRHEQANTSADVAEHQPLIAATMPWVAHRAIRTRGTVLGSIAHGDPAAEMPAVVLATGATLVATSASGRREIAARDFFEGYLDTALRADEILTEVTFPAWPSDAVGSVVEVARRHGDYALVGLVARLEIDAGDIITNAALAFFGAASTAIRVPTAEDILLGARANAKTFASAAQIVASELNPPADIHGTTAYRKHLASTLTRQGLEAAVATIGVPS
ncbi:FAD binding domain-containing protein [Ilumatobacter nonamiensis]|uniref:FAD binding domain-containing protein n=1 Tax=Ilumatobacter nonamiensis TaxID=467093 RepID=UPI00058DCAD5|nr:xanthine dehydrogenase family protein subunit M [Ilumatobacter nonamiensis]